MKKVSLLSVVLVLATCLLKGCHAQNAFCYVDSGAGNCIGNDDPPFVSVSECCSSATIRTTYQVAGSEQCSTCPENSYRCYFEDQCGSISGGPVTIISYSVNGARVCCNGSYPSWDEQSTTTCNQCPTSEATTATTTTESTTQVEMVTTSMSGNSTRTDPVQAGSGCSAGCIAGIVVGSTVALVAAVTIIIVAIGVLTRK